MFVLKALKYIFTRLNKYTSKRKLIIETADVILLFCWLVLLPVLHWSNIQAYIELLV